MSQNFSTMEQRPKRSPTPNEKRFPRSYQLVERILKEVNNGKGSIKTVFYSSNIPRKFSSNVYRLAHEVLRNKKVIQSIIQSTRLLQQEPGIRKEAAEIMVYEMVIKQKELPGESKPVLVMKKYSKALKEALSEAEEHGTNGLEKVMLPRYARINTLSISVSQALTVLKYDGYERILYDSGISYNDYEKLVLNLQPRQFVVDIHFGDLLVFRTGEKLTVTSMFTKGQLFLQDKTSYVPVHVLAPEPGSTVIDACAAPGMKTSHIAAVMNNKGLIYAFDNDSRRFERMSDILKRGNVKICSPINASFKRADPLNETYSSAKYILVDPTCSGSGMVNRMDEVTDKENSKNIERIKQLAKFQIILLEHALSFPNVKRVVYSTCSTSEEENECVVEDALKVYGETFEVVPAMPEWSCRGSSNYPHGKLCFRAVPGKNLTNGFFVAAFERKKSAVQTKSPKSGIKTPAGTPLEGKKSKKMRLSQEIGNGVSENADQVSSPQAQALKSKSTTPLSGKKNGNNLSQGLIEDVEDKSDWIEAKEYFSPQAKEIESKSGVSAATPKSRNRKRKSRHSQGNEMIEAKKNFSPQNKELKSEKDDKPVTPSSGQKKISLVSPGNVNEGSDLVEEGSFTQPKTPIVKDNNKSVKTPLTGKNKKFSAMNEGELVSPQTSGKKKSPGPVTPSSGQKKSPLSPGNIHGGSDLVEEGSFPQPKTPIVKDNNKSVKTPLTGKNKKFSAMNEGELVSPQTSGKKKSPGRLLRSGKKINK